MIYLDNAATTYPKPQSVKKVIMNATARYGANPGRSGHKMSIETATEIYKTRKSVCDFFNAPNPENVIFTLNCTQAINFVLKGFLKSGDHVIASCLEHNSVTRPLNKLKKMGIDVDFVDVCPCDNDKTLDKFRKKICERTKLIVCTHASNVWGIRLPIERICALAHVYGISVLVDAAQSAGVIPIDLRDTPIDFLCTAGHKGLYGPMGTGLLIIRNQNDIETIVEGGTGTNSLSDTQPNFLPDKFESGTPNTSGIIALKEGIKFINQIGINNIFEHEMKLIAYLYDRLSKIKGIVLYTPKPTAEFFVPVLSFNIENLVSEEVASILNSYGIYVRAGLHCAPYAHRFYGTEGIGAVRVSVSYFTKKRDIDYLLSKVAYISKQSNASGSE